MRRFAMSVLQTLMLTIREQGKSDGPVVARVLVVVAQTIHVFVPALAIGDAARKRPQSSLGLPFNLPHLTLTNHAKRRIDLLAVSLGSLALTALACQQRLYLLQVLGWRKVAASMCHVVLEPVSLFVALVAVRLWATEGLRQK
jgi:hypothetical protein